MTTLKPHHSFYCAVVLLLLNKILVQLYQVIYAEMHEK